MNDIKQTSLKDNIPDASTEQMINLLLLKLSRAYKQEISINTFWPSYKWLEAIPPAMLPIVQKCLEAELSAAQMLGTRATHTLTMREKLQEYSAAVNRLLTNTQDAVLDAPMQWSGFKGCFAREIRGCGNSIKADNQEEGENKKADVTMALFEKFWSAYPRKKNKGDAEKWFKKNKPSCALTDEMVEAIKKAVLSDEWKKEGGQFIPYPASWLNSKGWADEYGNESSVNDRDILCNVLGKVPVYRSNTNTGTDYNNTSRAGV